MVKILRKYKEKLANNRHGDSVQGETVFKFPLIDDISRNNMVSVRIDFCFENFKKLKHESVKDNKRRSQESRKKLVFVKSSI